MDFYDSEALYGKEKPALWTRVFNCDVELLNPHSAASGVVSLAVVDAPLMLLKGSRKRSLFAMGAKVAVQLAVDLPRVFFAPIAKIVGVAFG